MGKARKLLSYHNLTIEVETSPSEELLEHMYQTVMGQPGGMQYHHTNLEEKVQSGEENYFMYLRKSGKMLGSVGFASKPTETAGLAHDSWLIRYFSIKAPIKGVPKKRKTREELQDENKRTTVLGRFIQPVFANPSQLREGEGRDTQEAIIFAIIDQSNLRSMNFSAQMGLETVGSLAAFVFSRFRPRHSERIEQVNDGEKASVLKAIKDYYKDYTLFYSDSIFRNNDYYMIREKGRMVAGVQIYPVRWKIVDFGNRFANVTGRLLMKIPWVRKRISPDGLDFLAFDAIYCEPGYEKDLYELLEGVLERNAYYIGMMMMDIKSDLYEIFSTHKKLGLMYTIAGTTFADIRIRFINMPEAVRQEFYDRPTYIPTYDNT